MTKIAILPIPTNGGMSYCAVSGTQQFIGKTVGQALDALTMQLGRDEANTLVIVQQLRPDPFFSAEQQQRMSELMERWRAARDRGDTLPEAEQAELDTLIETELRASAARTEALLRALAQ
jgi:hypothetical protein